MVEKKLNIGVHCVHLNADGIGYDEEHFRVGKCPGGGCKNKEDGQTGDKARKKRVGSTATGKRVNLFTYFGKTKEDDQEKVLTSTWHNNESNPDETVKISVSSYSEEIGSTLTHGHGPVVDSTKTISQHRKKVLEDKENVFVNVENKRAKVDKTDDTLSKKTVLAADQIGNETTKNEISDSFKKVYKDLDPNQIHDYYFCNERNCKEICSTNLASMTEDNKFQHKWIFDPAYAFCEKKIIPRVY